ncbi:hypothetical protein [Tenacibaculum geojense]|uniref:Heme oxygenase n=1 Tax=Tenacibaculum geojense TaxID=915352 RepID=A0ABW3JPX6_9FLAO
MESLLNSLRYSTSKVHSAIHNNHILNACQEKKITLNEYKQMLWAFYKPWRDLIPNINKLKIPELKPKLVIRHHKIYDDLIHLNINPSNLVLNNESQLSEKEILGILYVVLGSSMGSKQLATNLKQTLKNIPYTYLAMSPKEAGWDILTNYLKSQTDSDYSVSNKAAITTFKIIDLELSNTKNMI